ncbi:TIGR03620 family F420-dependent LLM class oxidoreductase [Sphaerisporangium sp. NPDC004334]
MHKDTSAVPDPAELRRRLGRSGVWLGTLGRLDAESTRRAAGAIEDLGYRSLWISEVYGAKDSLVNSGILLSATDRLIVATGIANLYARDAASADSGANALAEAWSGRFILGLGVSHVPLVAVRGHDYGKPVSTMRAYLDAMDQAPYQAPLPERPARVLAALRSGMLRLAAERTQGAHTYFVGPDHTAKAREILGPEPLLVPEQAVVLDTDADRARATAREYMALYLTLPNYLNNLREMGWGDADFADGGSDALVDAIVAWGDADAIGERVRAHHDAGADHVCVQPLTSTIDETLTHLGVLAATLTT